MLKWNNLAGLLSCVECGAIDRCLLLREGFKEQAWMTDNPLYAVRTFIIR